MGDNVSKPPLQADLTVLCVDGTKASDSAMFAYRLELAGKSIKPAANRAAIQNLLTLVGSDPPQIDIQAPGGDPAVFPFPAAALSNLPFKKEALPGSQQRIAYVLLPQGEVGAGNKADFTDSGLGPGSASDHYRTAQHNSELLKRLCLAPGISNAGTASAQLDFATSSNVGTDILYLSGHGSMAGVVCGEADYYMPYFELLSLVKDEFQSIAKGDFRSPFWIVIGSCFSMRPSHAEIWLRFLTNQAVPLRGLLGYQTTSPLADISAEINRVFAQRLGEGDTFLAAWQKANQSSEGWTGMAFDHAKNDTLTSLRDLKRGTDTSTSPPPPGQRNLRFYEQGRDALVQITPPTALLTVHHWEQGFGMVGDPTPPPWNWNEILVTNIDFTEDKFNKAIADDPMNNGQLVSNGSWQGVGIATLIAIPPGDVMTRLCPGRIFKVRLFPPFTKDFQSGFQDGDEIELGLVHVRQTYTKLRVNFLSVFDIIQVDGVSTGQTVYGIPPPDSSLGNVQAAFVRNRIVLERPTGRLPFEPVSVTVRYKTANASQHFLWFWFSVKVRRNGTELFAHDFDNFIITAGSGHHQCSDPMGSQDPLPAEDVWGHPP
jgi:hypothetical protein